MKTLHKFTKHFIIPGTVFLGILFLFLSNPDYVKSSDNPNEKCGTVEYNDMLMQKYPEFKANLEAYERNMKNYQVDADQPVVTIPVVVHIVWNQPDQNISDAQVLSQIAVLNNDFRKLNGDTTEIPDAWKGIAADCQLQFCLAQRDPSGNPTNGITRTFTNRTSFGNSLDSSVKYTSLGGHDAWNRNKYLNLWVCNLGGGLLGYAQFPGGPAGTDGVVIGYKYFGTVGVVVPPYDLGRTATHEIGHWMNLRHIWGDEPLCNNDDGVSDTPLQSSASGGCPNFPITDNCSPNYPGIMFMNYMDYTDDGCMMMYTNGQHTRVQATINGIRASLMSSDGCQPVGGGQMVIQEQFENTAFPPQGWTLGYNGTPYWSRSTDASGYGNGTGSAKYQFYEAPQNTVQALMSNQFTPVGAGFSLTFDHAYATYQTEVDSLLVFASTNGGSTYNVLAVLLGGPNVGTGMVTAPPTESEFIPAAGQWATKSYPLPQGTNKIAFVTVSQYGNDLYLDNIRVGNTIGIKNNESNVADKFNLYQNYPNPFNPVTYIKFDVQQPSHVVIKIYDINGREVANLVDRELMNGRYTVDWNAENFSSGVYIYVLQAGNVSLSKKMVLLK